MLGVGFFPLNFKESKMKKAEYLDQVQEFTAWMARHISDSELGHHYQRPNAAHATQFANLADAARKYEWPIAAAVRDGEMSVDLAANTRVLERLQSALKNARTDEAMRDACIAVMQWGGVVNGNVPWLEKNTVGLAPLVKDVAKLLCSDDEETLRLPENLRFNAGMTKVYSLLLDNFIIYDSRVAAALCWFITHWAIESNAAAIPEALRFPCMPAKEGYDPQIRKLRNPSVGAWQFPQLNNRPRLHAHWNLRASWLLEAALKEAGPETAFHKFSQPLRALEAALFMWGYDLSCNLPGTSQQIDAFSQITEDDSDPSEEKDLAISDVKSTGYELNTLGKKKPFSWYFDEERDLIIIGGSGKPQAKLSTAQMFLYLHALYEQFDSGGIPLANNREFKLTIAQAPDGMGKTLWTQLGKELPLASRIGAILVAIGQLSWNKQPKNITFRFELPPPADIATLRDQLSPYAK